MCHPWALENTLPQLPSSRKLHLPCDCFATQTLYMHGSKWAGGGSAAVWSVKAFSTIQSKKLAFSNLLERLEVIHTANGSSRMPYCKKLVKSNCNAVRGQFYLYFLFHLVFGNYFSCKCSIKSWIIQKLVLCYGSL